VLDGDTFQAAVAELTLAALVEEAADADARVADAIAAEGWRSDGGSLPGYAVPSAMTDVRYLLLAIGAARGDALALRAGCTLTEPGRALILFALRVHALRRPPSPPPLPDLQPPQGVITGRVSAALPPVPGGAPPHLDPADEDERAELISLAHPELAAAIGAGQEVVVMGGEAVNPRLHLLMHQVVADHLLNDDSPEAWLALEALLEPGIDAHEAQHAIGRQLVEEMLAKLGPPPPPEARPRGHADRRARDRRKAQRAARRRNRR
jgi:hypothetical protein